MNLSVLQNIKSIEDMPYPHVMIDGALPDDLYAELAASRPDVKTAPGSNMRFDRRAHDLLASDDVSALWRQFVEYHTSADFWLEIVRVFGDSIKRVYPNLERQFGLLETWTVAPRFAGGSSTIRLECIVGLNTPVRSASRIRGPHVDSPDELWAGLLYMRPASDLTAGGDFQIMRPTVPASDLVFRRKAELPDDVVQVVRIQPYRANSFVGFVSSPLSIHGVSARQVGAPARLFVNVSAEMNEKLFSLRYQ